MIRQQVNQLGDFGFRLRDDTPRSVVESISEWDLFVLCPEQLPDPNPTRAMVLASAYYSGRIEKSSDHMHAWSGESSLVYLGDGDSTMRGGFGTAILPVKTLAQFLTSVTANPARVGGLTLGTAYSSPATTINADSISDTEAPRQALNRFCRTVGAEIRVNAAGTIDYGIPSALWKSGANIDLLLREGGAGNDLDGINGLNVTRWNIGYSRSEYLGKVSVNYGSPASNLVVTNASQNAFDGSTAWYPEKFITVPTGDATDATGIAQNYIDATGNGTFTVSCSVDTDDIYRYLTNGQPGDCVWAFDEGSDFSDLGNQVIHRGETLWPRSDYRLVEVTAPTKSGMGPYVIHTFQGSNAVLDLAPYIEWETGDTDLVLALSNPLTLRDAINGTTPY